MRQLYGAKSLVAPCFLGFFFLGGGGGGELESLECLIVLLSVMK